MADGEFLTREEQPPFSSEAIADPDVAAETIGSLAMLRVLHEFDPDVEARAHRESAITEVATLSLVQVGFLHAMGQALVSGAQTNELVHGALVHSRPAQQIELGARQALMVLDRVLNYESGYGRDAIVDAIHTHAHNLLDHRNSEYEPQDRADIRADAAQMLDDPDQIEALAVSAMAGLTAEVTAFSPEKTAAEALRHLHEAPESLGVTMVEEVTMVEAERDAGREETPPWARRILDGMKPLATELTPVEAYEQGVWRSLAFVACTVTVTANGVSQP